MKFLFVFFAFASSSLFAAENYLLSEKLIKVSECKENANKQAGGDNRYVLELDYEKVSLVPERTGSGSVVGYVTSLFYSNDPVASVTIEAKQKDSRQIRGMSFDKCQEVRGKILAQLENKVQTADCAGGVEVSDRAGGKEVPSGSLLPPSSGGVSKK